MPNKSKTTNKNKSAFSLPIILSLAVILVTVVALAFVIVLFTGEGETSFEAGSSLAESSETVSYPSVSYPSVSYPSVFIPTDETLEEGTYYTEIEMEGGGEIVLELYADIAPITVTNFVKLVQEKFYDGLTFHRVISGFMIQGGDPNGDGTGGSDEKIFGEFSINGFENTLSHTRGVISMARREDPYYDSASSQFFIVHADSTFLDGSYAAFGRVISGMEVVDAVAAVKVQDTKPVEDVVIKTVRMIAYGTDSEEVSSEADSSEDVSSPSVSIPTDETLEEGTYYAEMEMEDGGKIVMELYADIAPITVTNFVKLVQEKFYDGLTFHRVMSGFMIQGGDPQGDGTGGSDEKIFGEFAANGFENNLSHTRGVISMARRSYPLDSASSQFFICHGDCTFLDGDYAAFGRVISGMDVVDRIASVPVKGEMPLEKVVIKSIRMIDKPAA